MDRESGRAYVDDESEIVKPGDKALRELCFVAPIEMIGAEITVVSVAREHVIGGREHRSGDREDGLLGSAATLDPKELGSEVRVFLSGGGPGGLDERGLEPGIARARASREAFAGALVQAGAQPGPRYEMGGAREARHVEADLGHDHPGDGFADAGHGDQVVDGGTKGSEGLAQARLHV